MERDVVVLSANTFTFAIQYVITCPSVVCSVRAPYSKDWNWLKFSAMFLLRHLVRWPSV